MDHHILEQLELTAQQDMLFVQYLHEKLSKKGPTWQKGQVK